MSKTHTELVTELGRELNALLVASRTVIAASAARFRPDLQPAAYQLAAMLAGQGATKAGRLADRLDCGRARIKQGRHATSPGPLAGGPGGACRDRVGSRRTPP